MTRRMAAVLAGTVVLGLVAAMFTVSLHLGALRDELVARSSDGAAGGAEVRKVTRTVTVHKTEKESAEDQQAVTIVEVRSPAPTDGSYEDHEDAEHGDEHHGDEHGDEHHEDEKSADNDTGDKF